MGMVIINEVNNWCRILDFNFLKRVYVWMRWECSE